MAFHSHSHRLLAALIAAAFCAAPALAKNDQDKADKQAQKHEEKADKKAAKQGGGKPENNEHKEAHKGGDPKPGSYFSGRDRESVRTYYAQHYGGGKGCPPGVAVPGAGSGVGGMRERVRLHGGRFALSAREGGGCRVGVAIPLDEAAGAAHD